MKIFKAYTLHKEELVMKSKSDLILFTAAVLALALSVYLWFLVDKQSGIFVGLWVPSILALGSFFRT
jgi:hypothetical protein